MPKPRCLSPAANSLCSRIAGGQVPKPRCLSPAANSLCCRNAGGQVPKPRRLSPENTHKNLPRCTKGCLDFHLKLHNNDSTTVSAAKTLFGVQAQVSYIYIWLTAVGSGGTTLGGELCRFLDLVGHGAKFDQTESCGSSVERGPG